MTKNEWLKVIDNACNEFGFYDTLELSEDVRISVAEHYYHEMFNNLTVYDSSEEVITLGYLSEVYARAYMSMTDSEEVLEVLQEYLE